MQTIDTLVIGAGHAGLAVSRSLHERGIEHVVLERGRIAERWRSARWDSFRLLTPRWLARLPGYAYAGPDPDGFMSAPEFVSYLEGYARQGAAPVQESTTVLAVRTASGGYRVDTDRGGWAAANVVIATGYHARALIPLYAAGLPPELAQLTPAGYRGPDQVPDGVLVVGASASGVQLAEELARAGRRVVLAVGSHTRLPRRYRGRDICWWLDRNGSFDRTADEIPVGQREPSLQLSGTGRGVDLNALQELGVRLTGRLTGVDSGVARFADDLADSTAAAEARMLRVLATVDSYAATMPGVPTSPRPRPVVAPPGPRALRLDRERIGAVVWATGMRPWYPWLDVAVLDDTGHLRHRRGVVAPGLYAVGLRFQHRRGSTFIDGARHDAAYIVDHIAARRQLRPA
jgi:putative flavoprotein involved in K+ transport